MWTNILTILVTLAAVVAKDKNDTYGNDEGNIFFTNCNLQFLDSTITSSTTDPLRLWLFTSDPHVHHTYNITKAASIIKDSAFKANYRTVLFSQEFSGIPNGESTLKIASAYMEKGSHNVIFLDSSSVITIPYLRSARLIRYIGARLGLVLIQLSKTGLNITNTDLIGFGLGAHIMGFAGRTFKKSTGKGLPRIVALDPAGPCFRSVGEDERLTASDADFVQVLHTNGGTLGLMNAIGDADFYINGGRWQLSESMFRPCSSVCSHSRVVDIWCAVILDYKIEGVKCNSVEELDAGECYGKNRKKATIGPKLDPKTKGIFYAGTSNRYPYYLGNEGLYPPGCYYYAFVYHL